MVLGALDFRYYKGKYKVIVITKGKRQGKKGPLTWKVKALENIPLGTFGFKTHSSYANMITEGEEFTTIPRLLWNHSKSVSQEKMEQ